MRGYRGIARVQNMRIVQARNLNSLFQILNQNHPYIGLRGTGFGVTFTNGNNKQEASEIPHC